MNTEKRARRGEKINGKLIEMISSHLHYDENSGNFVRVGRGYWRSPKGSAVGSVRTGGYISISFKGVRYFAHRLAFYICHGYVPSEIDHINGDRSDNRICNLREATRTQNNWNTKLKSNNTSGITGACWDKQTGKWYARVSTDTGNHIGKRFDDFFDACCFIISARNKYHGEFQYGRLITAATGADK